MDHIDMDQSKSVRTNSRGRERSVESIASLHGPVPERIDARRLTGMSVLQLQRLAGNRAVASVLSSPRAPIDSGLSAVVQRQFDLQLMLQLPPAVAAQILAYLPLHEKWKLVVELSKKYRGKPAPNVGWLRDLFRWGKAVKPQQKQFVAFLQKHNYVTGGTFSMHELFGHESITIYPKEKQGVGGAEGESLRKAVHRPILDLEVVQTKEGPRLFARCYLGLFSKASGDSHKDITADESGAVELKNIGLMNLGNPFKALLWCEDYLSSREHEGDKPPDPVIRSFLVPLEDADWLLSGEARPLDKDRASGQFGTAGQMPDHYKKHLHPLAGSLVSFFLNVKELANQEKGQTKLPMSLMQHFLTGHGGDPRDMTLNGIAAQHGRKGHQAEFDARYANALIAYYDSLKDTGFVDATQDVQPARPGKYKKQRSQIQEIDLSQFPHVIAEKERHPTNPKDEKENG